MNIPIAYYEAISLFQVLLEEPFCSVLYNVSQCLAVGLAHSPTVIAIGYIQEMALTSFSPLLELWEGLWMKLDLFFLTRGFQCVSMTRPRLCMLHCTFNMGKKQCH